TRRSVTAPVRDIPRSAKTAAEARAGLQVRWRFSFVVGCLQYLTGIDDIGIGADSLAIGMPPGAPRAVDSVIRRAGRKRASGNRPETFSGLNRVLCMLFAGGPPR